MWPFEKSWRSMKRRLRREYSVTFRAQSFRRKFSANFHNTQNGQEFWLIGPKLGSPNYYIESAGVLNCPLNLINSFHCLHTRKFYLVLPDFGVYPRESLARKRIALTEWRILCDGIVLLENFGIESSSGSVFW